MATLDTNSPEEKTDNATTGAGDNATTSTEGGSIASATLDSESSSSSQTALVVQNNPSSGAGNDDDRGDDNGEKRLTIIEHLEELRQRIMVSAIAVAITTAFSFIFAKQLFTILKAPAGNIDFQAIEVTEIIGTYFKVSLFAGIILAIPVLVYEVVMYISPALTPKERKYFLLFLPGALICFVIGVVFGYFFVLPPMLNFLLNFGSDIAPTVPRIGPYVDTVTRVLFYIGVMFETPLVIFFLTKLHILSPKRLSRLRKYAIVGSFVIAAVITPTPDPLNQTIIAVPLILLYEVGVLLARFA